MNNFRSDNRGGGRRNSFRRDQNRDFGRREMFSAVCANCGKDCQVPFRPSGDKPVYCSDCFEEQGGRDSDRSRNRGSRDRGYGRGSDRPQRTDGGSSEMAQKIEALSTKLDKIISLLTPADMPKDSKAVEEKSEAVEEPKVVKAKKTSVAKAKKAK